MPSPLPWTMTRQTIEQVLARQGRGFFHTEGDSMEPLLHHRRSTVVIEAVNGPLNRCDVALYRRPTGAYVLHRVVKVLDGAYLIRGDNRLHGERVPAEWVIGVMTGYYADESGAYIGCESPRYQAYLRTLNRRRRRLWLLALPERVRNKLSRRSVCF